MSVLPEHEDLQTEFKSDRKPLSDRELVEAVVCLANAEGGTLYLGVEDNGRATGLHDDRRLDGCGAVIANRTSPTVTVGVEQLLVGDHRVARITVPKARAPVATTDGVMRRRRIGSNGKPECVAFLPSEIPSRLSDLGALDVSAGSVSGATLDDLDPVERARVRQFVERFHGDRVLLDLSDDELDGALRLTIDSDGVRVPTLTGLLLVGRHESLRRLVPTHEVAFQVLEGDAVRYNEFRQDPLLRIVEWLDAQFSSRNPEQELQVGLFRVGVPRVDAYAFREATANALVHRDYARLGAVHVRLDEDALMVSNPGGFVEGVTPKNILATPPRPRNPVLADAFKRIGLVERTGRGVGIIYRETLRFGRPAPSYAGSDSTTVMLRIPAAEADLAFVGMVVEAERERKASLPVDSLIALAHIRGLRQVTARELAGEMEIEPRAAKRTLEALVEVGLVEPRGSGRARHYLLSRRVYAQLRDPVAHTRQRGMDDARIEQLVLQHASEHGSIARGEVMDLSHLSGDQATYLLKRLVDEGKLVSTGSRRWTRYRVAGEPND